MTNLISVLIIVIVAIIPAVYLVNLLPITDRAKKHRRRACGPNCSHRRSLPAEIYRRVLEALGTSRCRRRRKAPKIA